MQGRKLYEEVWYLNTIITAPPFLAEMENIGCRYVFSISMLKS